MGGEVYEHGMLSNPTYNSAFFDLRSQEMEVADSVLAHVLPLVKPNSIVDFGTAVGTWLNSAKRSGVQRVLGLDGPWVPADKLLIQPAEFVATDMEGDLPDLGRFDLAICAEVLEHLSQQAGERAVRWLCRSADVVLFSAAVPLQGGEGHVNEQWQSYWAKLFDAEGFKTYDAIRPLIWSDSRVPFWYRQNLLLMATGETGRKLGLIPAHPGYLDLVHPGLFKLKTDQIAKIKSRTLKARVKRLFV